MISSKTHANFPQYRPRMNNENLPVPNSSRQFSLKHAKSSESVSQVFKNPQTGERYMRSVLLGKGGFAEVYECVSLDTSEKHAVKIVPKKVLSQNRVRRKIQSEIEIHRQIYNTRIVKMHSCFLIDDDVYILMELCTKYTLADVLRKKSKLDEPIAKYYIRELLLGLEYLHKHLIIHRDIKLGNLFLGQSNELKIGDFGLAAKLQNPLEKRNTICGTPNYIAPEILAPEGSHSFEADIWSCGVLCFALLTGRPPFEDEHVEQTYERIKSNSYKFPGFMSSGAKEFISSIIQQDPKRRPSIQKLLNSSWLRNTPASPPMDVFSSMARYPDSRAPRLKENVPSNRNDEFASPKIPSGTCPMYNTFRRTNTCADLPMKSSYHVKKMSPSHPFRSKKQSSSYPLVFIRRYVDYSTKYGIGFITSNETLGVLFNDLTYIYLPTGGKEYVYVDQYGRVFNGVFYSTGPVDTREMTHDVNKKVTLLGSFEKYFRTPKEDKELKYGSSGMRVDSDSSLPPAFLRRWLPTSEGVIFSLSNKYFHAIFKDTTELVIDINNKTILFLNKKSEVEEYNLSDMVTIGECQVKRRYSYFISKLDAEGQLIYDHM